MLLGACTPHPVGPARTFSKYEGKAVTTAEAALSSIATVQLAARSAAKGNTTGPYVSVLISNQEDALSGVQGTFDSIQPPDSEAEELRDDLDELVASGLDHVADVRIAARRGHLSELEDIAQPLQADAQGLTDFIEEHE